MEKQMTAVEWLFEQISSSKFFYYLMEDINNRNTVEQSDIFEQAKEMEKEQKGYSKEDMKKAIKFGLNGMYGYQFDEEGETENQISKYFKQFKNK